MGPQGEQGPQGEPGSPGVTVEQVTEIVQSGVSTKQDALTGQPGQVVGFDANGVAKSVRGWSNPNLLDNWYFVGGGSQLGEDKFPINQKGQTEYGPGYTIDRWEYDGDDILRIEDDGIVLSNNETENRGLYQKLERERLMPGMVYTISVLVSELDGTARLTFWGKSYVDIHPGINSYTLTHIGDEAETIAYPVVHLHGTIKPIAVKLELGPIQTLAYQDAAGNWVLSDPPPDKTLELLKCQRYYRVFSEQSRRPTKAVDFCPPMRVNPTMGTIKIDGVTYYTADANL